MSVAGGPDHMRVLSDLVVGALLDDVARGPEDDAFSDALRRYRDEGAPRSAVRGGRAFLRPCPARARPTCSGA